MTGVQTCALPISGIVHPSKLYNILTVGSPFLYIGPRETHVSEIARQTNGEFRAYTSTHGDVQDVEKHILEEADQRWSGNQRRVPSIANAFSKQRLLPQLIKLLECQVLEAEISKPSGSTNFVSAAP